MLVHVPELHHHVVLGQTLDDAAGEAFDKVARLLGLGFPGGPAIDAMAAAGRPARAIAFPRAMAASEDLDFSMSGLKTAVLRYVQQERSGRPRARRCPTWPPRSRRRSSTCRSRRRSRRAELTRVGTVLLGGGVVANTRLRDRLTADGAAAGLRVLAPPLELCTDNAAMIACLGAAKLARGERTSLDIAADPNLRLAP